MAQRTDAYWTAMEMIAHAMLADGAQTEAQDRVLLDLLTDGKLTELQIKSAADNARSILSADRSGTTRADAEAHAQMIRSMYRSAKRVNVTLKEQRTRANIIAAGLRLREEQPERHAVMTHRLRLGAEYDGMVFQVGTGFLGSVIRTSSAETPYRAVRWRRKQNDHVIVGDFPTSQEAVAAIMRRAGIEGS